MLKFCVVVGEKAADWDTGTVGVKLCAGVYMKQGCDGVNSGTVVVKDAPVGTKGLLGVNSLTVGTSLDSCEASTG